MLKRTSYGLGEMIKHALDNDAKHVVISLGGIDSFDAGAGMLQALGAQFYDDSERPCRRYETRCWCNIFVVWICRTYTLKWKQQEFK